MYAYKSAIIAYRALLFIALIAMIMYWVYKYIQDEDLCLVDYKSFNDDKNEENLPTLSICFHTPFIEEKFPKLKSSTKEDAILGSALYSEYLKGKRSNFTNQFANITYNDIAINARTYLTRVKLIWNNGSFSEYSNSSLDLPIQFYTSFDGIAKNLVFKCFGTEVIKKYKNDINTVVTYYERDSVLGRFLNQRAGAFSSFQYTRQFLYSPTAYLPLYVEKINTTQNTLWHILTDMEILQRRNKRTDKCTDDWEFFDVLNAEKHIEYHGCRPPYLASSNKQIPICNTQSSIHESGYIYEVVIGKYLKKPCQSMTRITFDLNGENQAFPPADNEIGIGIFYPALYKYIVQSQAVDGHSLIGNMGGYIGLFLGRNSLYVWL